MSEVKHIVASVTFEVPLTPVRIRSKFTTLSEWLITIGQGKKPTTSISEFNIDLSFRQSSNEFIVCLYGVNTRIDKKQQSYTFIDFEPSNMWFKFPKRQFKKFSYRQMKHQLTMLLSDFTLTEIFKNSFMSNSNIRTNYNGELIWSIN